jgi:hypothetical protein
MPMPACSILDERRKRYRNKVLWFKPVRDEAARRNLLNRAKNKELFRAHLS